MEVGDYTRLQMTVTATHVCRDYTMRVFVTGDYEFLTRSYGLSGASGKPYMYVSSITN